jgi:hypothetical protein
MSKWSNICKREETYSLSLSLNQKPPNPTKKTHKRTKKREIAFDSPPTQKKTLAIISTNFRKQPNKTKQKQKKCML